MQMYLRDRSAQRVVRAATLRQTLQIKLFYLTQSQYPDTVPTSPSADHVTSGAWQGSHWSANFKVTGMTRPGKIAFASGTRTPGLPLEADALTTKPAGWFCQQTIDRLAGLVVKASASGRKIRGLNPACDGIFWVR